jgi:hypothetical protein
MISKRCRLVLLMPWVAWGGTQGGRVRVFSYKAGYSQDLKLAYMFLSPFVLMQQLRVIYG